MIDVATGEMVGSDWVPPVRLHASLWLMMARNSRESEMARS